MFSNNNMKKYKLYNRCIKVHWKHLSNCV